MNRQTAVFIGVTALLVLLVAGGILYAFGAPQQNQVIMPRQVQPSEIQNIADQGAPMQSGKPEVAKVSPNAKAPAPDPKAPLAIQIPGCRCHSDDPKLVKQHEAYRMNQCAGCHAGRTPTGQ